MSDRSGEDRDLLSRRSWLKNVGATAGGVAVLPALAACEDGTGASTSPEPTEPDPTDPDPTPVDPDPRDPDPVDPGPEPRTRKTPLRGDGSHPFHYIDTLVIVQMENRSFDHYYGALSLLEGRTDVDGLVDGMSNPDMNGDPVYIRHLTSEYVIDPDPPHGHSASVQQFNGGLNDGFVRAFIPRLGGNLQLMDLVMGYHTRDQLSALYGLADAFTLCDQWHCSLLAPTWPNRFYSHAATSDGRWGNLDSLLPSPTPYKELVEKGLTFGVYPAGPVAFSWTLQEIIDLGLELSLDNSLDRFISDAAEGLLPNISIVEPSYFNNDDHPPADIRQGQVFIQTVYEALRQSPHWERSLMLVFYDENGGFFDHVPPPKVQGEALAAQGFDQLGFRVPGLVVSPFSKREVFHELIDHASVPALISNLFELEHVNERSRLAGDLGAALSIEALDDPTPAIELPPIVIESEEMERSASLECGQPELVEFSLRHGLVSQAALSYRARRKAQDRYVRRMLDLGTLRIE